MSIRLLSLFPNAFAIPERYTGNSANPAYPFGALLHFSTDFASGKQHISMKAEVLSSLISFSIPPWKLQKHTDTKSSPPDRANCFPWQQEKDSKSKANLRETFISAKAGKYQKNVDFSNLSLRRICLFARPLGSKYGSKTRR